MALLRAIGIVNDPRLWGSAAGYEFWLSSQYGNLVASASATNPGGLDGWGWQTSGLSTSTDSTGDFLSSADQGVNGIYINAATDALVSPVIFGGYAAGVQAARFLGGQPTKLSLELHASFLDASANDTTTFFGLTGAGVVDAALAVSAGCIRSGGAASTFFLTSDNGSDAGAAIDTSFHKWKITYGATTTEWFIDDVSQGTITTELDVWPCAFKAYRGGATNSILINWVRIFYEL